MRRRLIDTLGANRIVVALSFARLVDALGNSILFILIPLYVGTVTTVLPLPEPVLVGLLISFFGLVSAALQPFLGAWVDRVGKRKPFILVGLAMMGLATLAFVAANAYYQLFVIRVLQGFGVALTIPASLALMAAASERSTRGGSMGIYTTCRMIGIAAGPILGGFIFDRWGFAPAFYVAAGLIALGMLLVQLWVDEVEDAPPPPTAGAIRIFDRELHNPGILGTTFAVFVMAAAITMMATLERQFNERLAQTALAFGIAFSALMVSRLAFQGPFGWLSDRVGRKPLVVAGLVLLAPATALLGVAATTLQLTLYRVIQGVGSAAVAAPGYALAADLSREGSEARQMGAVTTGFFLGLALGPLLAGILAVPFFELPFLVGGAMCLAGAWVVWRWVPETLEGEEATVAAD
ncbi:MAG: MFS transporter [Gemmatimonadetes bacterium]|nr:MFS transporter [Gemmatimonadota bacterium]NIR80508.1 MFS transporter [Gemmatimonadota bacterium]NIT89273.1 MFS transporter [Gemmatimonadota bacterium]NIU33071.1 MFS transporter [Gemmatimonadota bacterium]NIU37449.1 MFS transporter [Gemmatimonadota bacterium]